MSEPSAPSRPLLRRVIVWGLAILALAFVVRAVPIRDRCVDPLATEAESRAKAPPTVGVTREGSVYVFHRASGDTRLDASQFDPAKAKCQPGLVTTLISARVGVVVALCVMYIFGSLAWALRWRVLLTLADIRVPLSWVWRVTLEAQAGGILLPGGIAGDALRVTAMVGKGAPLATVIASVMLDRAVGLATLSGLAAALSLFFGHGQLGVLNVVLAALPIGFIVGLVLLRIPALARLPIFQRGRVADVVRPVLLYIGDPRAPLVIVRGVLFSIVVSAVQFGAVRGAIYALGFTPGIESRVYMGCTLAMIVSALPTLPGGWGTADAAYVYFLAPAGIPDATALAACLLYRLMCYVLAAIGAVLFFLRGGRATPSPS